jgi:hypothetical protein
MDHINKTALPSRVDKFIPEFVAEWRALPGRPPSVTKALRDMITSQADFKAQLMNLYQLVVLTKLKGDDKMKLRGIIEKHYDQLGPERFETAQVEYHIQIALFVLSRDIQDCLQAMLAELPADKAVELRQDIEACLVDLTAVKGFKGILENPDERVHWTRRIVSRCFWIWYEAVEAKTTLPQTVNSKQQRIQLRAVYKDLSGLCDYLCEERDKK